MEDHDKKHLPRGKLGRLESGSVTGPRLSCSTLCMLSTQGSAKKVTWGAQRSPRPGGLVAMYTTLKSRGFMFAISHHRGILKNVREHT